MEIDYLGKEIKKGDILSADTIGTEDEEKRDRSKAYYIVLEKVNKNQKYLFGLSLKRPKHNYQRRFYLHSIRFGNTIRIGNIKEMEGVLEKVLKDEDSIVRFEDSSITPKIHVHS